MYRSVDEVTEQDLSRQECDNSGSQVSNVLILSHNNIIKDELRCDGVDLCYSL